MATVCLLSAKGSPGVTTTAVGLALARAATGRRSLVVDADPSGGDIAAGILRGCAPDGTGMLALATARGVPAGEAVEAASTCLVGDGSARVIVGVPDAARSAALALAWDRISQAAPALAEAGVDLLVDAGRHDPTRPPGPWIPGADLALLVVRPSLPAVAVASRLAAAWIAPDSATRAVPLRVIVRQSPSPYGPAEVAAAIGLPLLGVVPHQPEHARVHSDGMAPGRGFRRSPYVRALQRLADDLARPAPSPQPLSRAAR